MKHVTTYEQETRKRSQHGFSFLTISFQTFILTNQTNNSQSLSNGHATLRCYGINKNEASKSVILTSTTKA